MRSARPRGAQLTARAAGVRSTDAMCDIWDAFAGAAARAREERQRAAPPRVSAGVSLSPGSLPSFGGQALRRRQFEYGPPHLDPGDCAANSGATHDALGRADAACHLAAGATHLAGDATGLPSDDASGSSSCYGHALPPWSARSRVHTNAAFSPNGTACRDISREQLAIEMIRGQIFTRDVQRDPTQQVAYRLSASPASASPGRGWPGRDTRRDTGAVLSRRAPSRRVAHNSP